MPLHILWLDMESFYSNEYSLTKMTSAEYVLDPRFEAIGCSFINPISNDAAWVDGPHLAEAFAKIDWKNTYAISHNGLFDFAILAWRYGIVPAGMGDTMAMARAWVSNKTNNGSVSLKEVARHLGLPPKGDTVFKMKGVSYAALRQDPALYEAYVEYGKHDAYLCREVFQRLLKDGFPTNQLEIIDLQLRMCVEPRLRFDQMVLAEHLNAVRSEKADFVAKAKQNGTDGLMSNDKFAALLTDAGVRHIPQKISEKTGEITWAFSKQDKSFVDLLEHEDEHVQNLVAARLSVKSTIEESRTETFLRLAQLPWPSGTSLAPVPLKYSGAHTGRFSGDWDLNLQNLGRKSKLRQALVAPPGHVVLSVDASQIEARITAHLAGQQDLVEAFAERRDVYAEFASELFRMPVTKETHERERFIGKTAVLQLGYGAGWASLQNQIRVNSERKVFLSDAECSNIVDFYRRRNPKIKELWDRMDQWIPCMRKGDDWQFGPLHIKGDAIILPNGMRLQYLDLQQKEKYGRRQWVYKAGRFEKILYGAKLLENTVQSLAFVIIMEAARRIKEKSKGVLMPVHQVHDELLFVVPESWADAIKKVIVDEVSRCPDWMPGLPLAAEAGAGVSYGAIKK